MRTLVLLAALALLPTSPFAEPVAAAATTSAWTVSAFDAEGDATGGAVKLPSCGATDLVAGSVSYTGTDYVWRFAVSDADAPCAPPHGHQSHFLLHTHDGRVAASVIVRGEEYRVNYADAPPHASRSYRGSGLFDGNVAAVELPATFGLSQEEAFAMTSYLQYSPFPSGCLVLVCVVVSRDHMSAWATRGRCVSAEPQSCR